MHAGSYMHKETLLHEDTILHKNTFALGSVLDKKIFKYVKQKNNNNKNHWPRVKGTLGEFKNLKLRQLNIFECRWRAKKWKILF